MFYSTTHSTHFIYGYMVSDMVKDRSDREREETCCCHMGYYFRLTARILLYAPSHRQDSTYHGLYYTSRGALVGTRVAQWVHPMKDRSDDTSHHERTLLPRSYISLRHKERKEKERKKERKKGRKERKNGRKEGRKEKRQKE